MIFYVQTKFTASTVGGRIVCVDCEKCSCQYYFELRRTGIGTGVAPYGLNQTGASEAAESKAKADIHDRLEGEAELVPCPKCNWINDELVRGYRQSCYRGYAGMAVLVAIVALSICLVMAWFIRIGPQADHGALPYLLIYFPVAIVGITVAFASFIGWLRARIQPNENFPLMPHLPSGTPQALTISASGELLPINVGNQLGDDESFDFQIGKHCFSAICCCCLEASSPKRVFEMEVLPGTSLQIPLCDSCGTRSVRQRKRMGTLVGMALSIVSVVLILILGLKDEPFWILAGASVVIAAIIGGFIAEHAVRPAWIIATDQMRGIIRLRFMNPKYRSSILECDQLVISGTTTSSRASDALL